MPAWKRASPTLGIWDHFSGAYRPQLQGLLHQPGDTIHSRWQSGEVMVRSSATGHSMVTKRVKSSIGAEWAHGPSRSIQPQPPPNDHLVFIRLQVQAQTSKRKHEELPLTGGELCWQGRKTPTRCGNVVHKSFLTRPSGKWESPEQN
eukprot:Em0002g1729a